MSARFYIISIVAVLLLAGSAGASSTATIHGVVYGWDTFEPLENAVVEVNSTPSQSMVAKYGLYSFELAPGDYTIKASYYQNSTLIYSKEETVNVEDEGNYVLDLLLLPVYSEELMDFSELPESSEETETISEKSRPESTSIEAQANSPASTDNTDNTGTTSPNTMHFFAGLTLSLLLVGTYHYSQRSKSSKPVERKEQKSILKPEQERPNTEHVQEQKETAKKNTSSEDKAAENRKEPTGSDKTTEESAKRPIRFGSEKPEKTEVSEKQERPEKTEVSEKQERPEKTEESGKSGKTDILETPEDKYRKYLPPDLQEVMDIIRGQGGRITQKELRSRIKYSEGKVSLMLADLERRGLIEKFKRGRGNVVILKDDEP